MSIPGDAIPQLVANVLFIVLAAWWAPKAFRKKKNRAPAVALAVIGVIGLWFNLHGHTLQGPVQGFGVY